VIKIIGVHVPRRACLLAVLDACFITLSLLLAVAVRFSSFSAATSTSQAVPQVLVVALVCGLSLYYHELYDLGIVRQRSVMFVRLLNALVVSGLALGALYYLLPQLNLGRGIALVAAPAMLSLILGARLVLGSHNLFRGSAERVLVVGTDEAGISTVREIIARPELNQKVVGFLDEKGENIGRSLVNPRVIGAVADLANVVKREKVDRIVLALRERRGNTPVDQLVRLKFAGVRVEDAHTVHEKVTGRILLERLSPSWLILSDGFRKSRFQSTSKRLCDVLLCCAALPVAFPLMGLVAVAIWLDTGGPVLFRQRRVGLGGTTFEILKFRSMYQNAEISGPRWAVEGDPRITRVGRFIRKFRLDELPQLINVLRGDMSLVGPRPEQPELCALLEREMPLFVQRYSVRPGITGWAQIKYQYGSSVEENKRKLEFDLYYIKHLSVFLDLAIILETFKVMLIGRGAK
jgi:sugar transferase (PEP-CTERM system associated)